MKKKILRLIMGAYKKIYQGLEEEEKKQKKFVFPISDMANNFMEKYRDSIHREEIHRKSSTVA